MKKYLIIAMLMFSGVGVADELFPGAGGPASAFYYKLGGGRSVPRAIVRNTSTISFNVNASATLGLSCGKFDPKATVTNALNNFTDSVQNVAGSIVNAATSAVVNYPMYMLMRSDPKLYNILNNNLLGAREDWKVKIRTCEEMSAIAMKQENPYAGWMEVSTKSSWKAKTTSQPDLNLAKKEVDDDNGKSGVPWPVPGGSSKAGGLSQQPIYAIGDAAKAGYNVMAGRTPSLTTPVTSTPQNQNLTNYWITPAEASEWIVRVVGDKKIHTCSTCGTSKTIWGEGLKPSIALVEEDVTTKLWELVTNPSSVNTVKLMEVSAPGVVVSTRMVSTIRGLQSNPRSLAVSHLAQNVALGRIINQALIAKDILYRGKQIDEISNENVAVKEIDKAIDFISVQIDGVLKESRVRKEIASDSFGAILEYAQSIQQDGVKNTPISNKRPSLRGGALMKPGL